MTGQIYGCGGHIMLTPARTTFPHTPPPPKKKRAKKGPPNGTVKDLKEHRKQKKRKSVVLGLTISMLFQQFGRPQFSIFFPEGAHPRTPQKPK